MRHGNLSVMPYRGPKPEEWKRKMRLAMKGKNTGKNNAHWKGDNVGIRELHRWVRRHLLKPDLCEMCNERSSYDLANMTGIYNREFKNWKYICRSCHIRSDGRIENLIWNRKR